MTMEFFGCVWTYFVSRKICTQGGNRRESLSARKIDIPLDWEAIEHLTRTGVDRNSLYTSTPAPRTSFQARYDSAVQPIAVSSLDLSARTRTGEFNLHLSGVSKESQYPICTCFTWNYSDDSELVLTLMPQVSRSISLSSSPFATEIMKLPSSLGQNRISPEYYES